MRTPILSSLVLSLSFLLANPAALRAQDPVEASGKVKTEAAKAAATLHAEAQGLVDAGSLEPAAKIYRKLTEADPMDATAWHMLGYCLHGLGKLDEALPIHMRAAGFPATKATGLYNAACVHALKKDVDGAAKLLAEAIDAGFAQIETFDGDSDFDAIRKDPRIAKLTDALRATLTDPTKAPPAQLYQVTTDRKSVRYLLMSRVRENSAQFAIDYGPAAWKDGYGKLVADATKDSPRWRFGQDFWTTLDTSAPIEFGGTKVPAGTFYLTLQRKGGKYLLQLHDPAAARAQRVDPYGCARLEGGIEVEMKLGTQEPAAEALEVAAQADAKDKTKGTLVVAFGPHRLTVPFAIETAASAGKTTR